VPAGGFVGLRPEDLSLVAPGSGQLRATVELVEALGAETLIYVTTEAGAMLVARQPTRSALHAGDPVGVNVAAANAHRFDAEGRTARVG
jgi:multiple sugar transport system ATP-binding protein